VSGDARPGSRITLRVDVDTLERYFETLRQEQRTGKSCSSLGRRPRGATGPPFDVDSQTELELPEGLADVQVAVAVRDVRGGLAMARQIIEVRCGGRAAEVR